MKATLSLLAVLAMVAPTLRAQVVNDGATNTLSNFTNTFPGDVTVGTNGSFTLLVLSDNVLLTNSIHGVIGRNNTANSNEVRLVSSSARWFMGGSLFVGSNGAANRLVVSNGATVLARGSGTLGHGGGFGGNANSNSATVSGPGSLWSNGLELVVGELGTANRVEVNNGGRVVSSNAVVGRSFFSPSNTVVVAGPGSVWSNRADVSVGGTGSGNLLVISNGGWMVNSNANIGESSLGNLALVTGINSTWSNRADLNVGNGARENQLVVSNGALVVDNNGVLGNSVTSSNNFALITGSGSLWSNRTNLDVGLSGAGNQLVVTNGGVVRNNFGILGVNSGSSNNVVLVAGSGSVWTNANDVYVGRSGAGNQLLVSDGGLVRNNDGYLGVNAGSSNNLALVTGPGSVWRNAGALFLGDNDWGNRLVVSNAGVVLGSAGYFGVGTGSSNNLAVVTDSNSVWSNTNDLYLGFNGAGNQLVVSNGAWVVNSSGFLGFSASSLDNVAMVSGAGSVWSNRANVYVGNSGRANQLVASSGATVSVGGNGVLGVNSGANSNSVSVTDPGTQWLLSSNLFVGSNGALNRLVITNGAFVADASGFIGAGVSSSNNLATVTGPGSVWSNAGDFFVGSSGAGNQLVVSNGALLLSSNAWLGFASTSRSNVALLAGAGTTWSNAQRLSVGDSGGGNRLTVSDGARIESDSGKIGFLSSSASNNEVVVTGPGSFWGTEDDLNVGGLGSGNRLVITNGGSVLNNGGAGIGTAMSVSNEVVVTGAGSSWTLGSTLFVGQVASGCRLAISNGGAVFQKSFGGLIVGSVSSSTNNRIEVDGGTLLVTNTISGTFDVRRGTTVLKAGLIEVTTFLLTNGQGFLQFNGGTLSTRSSTIGNGTLFRVGNGVSPATFFLAGNGLHQFNALLAAQVTSNATFTGNGTITGPSLFQLLAGSRLVPGTSVGKMVFSNSPTLHGTVVMEISKNGATLTNDQIQVIAPLTYGGSLIVSNLGPTALAIGDRFPLFSANSYAGGFTNIILPPLNAALDWTNKLLVDGSIEIVVLPGNRFWTNALGGSYQTAANWLDNVVPLPPDDAYFTNNADYQVTWAADALAANAFFNATSGIVTQAVGSASWSLTNSYIVGQDSASTAAVTHLSGSLRVTNPAGTAQLKVGAPGRGTFTLNGGSVVTDFLVVTNGTKSVFAFTNGTLRSRNTTVNNGAQFAVGAAAAVATFDLAGGTHSFVNGLLVQPKSLLTGTGTISANVTINGSVSPGSQGIIGRLAFTSGALNFSSTTTNIFDINKAAATNDVIAATSTLALNGTLIVTNLGGILTNGDRFQLFSSPFLASIGFNKVILPPLAPGLSWKNKTHTDGSIEVANTLARELGEDVSHFQGASGISQSSWDQMFAEGKRFVFIKATEGLTGPHDAAMSNNVTRAVAAGLLAGVYHFAHPENRPTTNGAVLEASNMVVYAGSAIGPGRLRPVLDLERGNGLTTTELTDWVIAFSNEIINQRGTAAAPIIYCGQSFANDELDSRLAGYDVWIRAVSGGSDPLADDPPPQFSYTNALGVFTNWAFWQYSDTGSSGGISPLDLDVCHSEYKPLSSFIIPGSTPAPIQIGSVTLSGNGAFQLGFTNTPGAVFSVLATTNLSIPISSWTAVGQAIEVSPGQFEFSDLQATNHPQRYYSIRSP